VVGGLYNLLGRKGSRMFQEIEAFGNYINHILDVLSKKRDEDMAQAMSNQNDNMFSPEIVKEAGEGMTQAKQKLTTAGTRQMKGYNLSPCCKARIKTIVSVRGRSYRIHVCSKCGKLVE